jgi:hypothetical protein
MPRDQASSLYFRTDRCAKMYGFVARLGVVLRAGVKPGAEKDSLNECIIPLSGRLRKIMDAAVGKDVTTVAPGLSRW